MTSAIANSITAMRQTRSVIRRDTDAESPSPGESQNVATEEALMSITKDYRYRARVDWGGDRLTSVTSTGKPELEVATPPEFKGGVAGIWSPEDLLVASAASCFTVTLVAVLERRDLRVRDITGTLLC